MCLSDTFNKNFCPKRLLLRPPILSYPILSEIISGFQGYCIIFTKLYKKNTNIKIVTKIDRFEIQFTQKTLYYWRAIYEHRQNTAQLRI